MTGEQFVKLCFTEKESILKEYFDENTSTEVGERLRSLVADGTGKDELYDLVSLILSETYYSLLMALDGEASLGGTQMTYQIFDEEQNLLNECGEIEAAAFEYFMEE
jgi:hypothetical protein